MKTPEYFLTLFKLEGHNTWRAHIAGHATGFEEEAKKNKFPKITEKRKTRIDRITGEFTDI